MNPANQYSGDGRDHHIQSVEDNGDFIVLEDGSRWQIYEGFVAKTRNWQVGEMITVTENRDELFPYRLINVHKNESVEVKLQ